MDTIHESTERMAVMSGVWPEPTTSSSSGASAGAGPSRSRTEPIISISPAVDRRPETPSSMKSPVGRKTSFRVPKWVKRSGSSRTITASVRSAPEAWRPQIEHLGGGRVEDADVPSIESALSSNNNSAPQSPSTLLVPGSTLGNRALKSDTGSIDSRATKWFDFYKEPPSETERSQSQPPPLRPKPSHERLPSRGGEDPAPPSPLSATDLRPPPLRLPSSEKSRSPKTPPPNTPLPSLPSSPRPTGQQPTPLARKDSKYKPLPILPPQQHRAEGGGSVAADKANPGSDRPKKPEYAVRSPSSQSQRAAAAAGGGAGGVSANRQDDWAFVAPPAIHVDTPPPTPDGTDLESIVGAYGGSKERREEQQRVQNKNSSDGAGAPYVPTPNAQTTSSATTTTTTSREREKGRGEEEETKPTRLARRPSERVDSLRHTRQERIWLHVNYRGEAPFLKAWGLDIGRRSDRLEGLAILRELIHAEAQERKRERGSSVGRQGGVDRDERE
ncbi:uncharacterized protein B0T15DRAFT_573259 [Chaetomium strumarium]|uniref:Uncharacterized protein n=1 Tax=Chaetomium strumarium TaxID=1170767 RepID=A0AAJ0GZW6_9PEZI|nr:hypothetical protein B0T15DRAFT_573259 [Chaetomium strumarium]